MVELMVACLLLGMLVSALTMIFNSASIAWRTGTAGVVELKGVRGNLGALHDIQDDLLPGLNQRNVTAGAGDNRTLNYRTVSLWKPTEDNALRLGQRAFNDDKAIYWGNAPQITIGDALTGASRALSGAGAGNGAGLFVVGVRSYGPDRKPNTEDDITTWPEDVQ